MSSVEITKNGVTVMTKDGKKQTIEADTVVPAMPLTENTGLVEALKGKVPEVYAVGDCKEPLLIVDAIGTGSRIARAVERKGQHGKTSEARVRGRLRRLMLPEGALNPNKGRLKNGGRKRKRQSIRGSQNTRF